MSGRLRPRDEASFGPCDRAVHDNRMYGAYVACDPCAAYVRARVYRDKRAIARVHRAFPETIEWSRDSLLPDDVC